MRFDLDLKINQNKSLDEDPVNKVNLHVMVRGERK
jgi:hypothetical protein